MNLIRDNLCVLYFRVQLSSHMPYNQNQNVNSGQSSGTIYRSVHVKLDQWVTQLSHGSLGHFTIVFNNDNMYIYKKIGIKLIS